MDERLRVAFGHFAKIHTVLFGQITFSLAPNQAAHLEQSHEIHSTLCITRDGPSCTRLIDRPEKISTWPNPGEISGLVILPILPTMGVGSYASPGWLVSARKMLRDGELGERDIEELFDDALAICIGDQLEAGVDILTDGELRRQRFVFELYDALEGLERVKPLRRVGVSGYDMAPHFVRVEPLSAPDGLGVVQDFLALKRKAPPGHRLKSALPGP